MKITEMVFLGQKSEGRGRQGAQVNFLGSGETPPPIGETLVGVVRNGHDHLNHEILKFAISSE